LRPQIYLTLIPIERVARQTTGSRQPAGGRKTLLASYAFGAKIRDTSSNAKKL